MVSTVSLVNKIISYRYKIKEIEKIFFLVMRTLRVYSQQFTLIYNIQKCK